MSHLCRKSRLAVLVIHSYLGGCSFGLSYIAYQELVRLGHSKARIIELVCSAYFLLRRGALPVWRILYLVLMEALFLI